MERSSWSGSAVAALAVAAAWLACTGPANLRQAALDRGEELAVSRPAEEVLPVAREAVREAGFDVEETARGAAGTWAIYGERLLGEREVAARVRVVVRELGPGETSVRVLVRRTVPTEFQVGGDEYTDRILSWIAAQLLESPGSAARPTRPAGVGRVPASVDQGESAGISWSWPGGDPGPFATQ